MATDRLGRVPTIVLALLVPLVALVTVLVTLNVTDDSKSSASSGSGSAKGGAGTALSIKNFQYSPDPFTVKAGATVTVSNDDGTTHTLTADKGEFDTGDLDGGAKANNNNHPAGQEPQYLPVHH